MSSWSQTRPQPPKIIAPVEYHDGPTGPTLGYYSKSSPTPPLNGDSENVYPQCSIHPSYSSPPQKSTSLGKPRDSLDDAMNSPPKNQGHQSLVESKKHSKRVYSRYTTPAAASLPSSITAVNVSFSPRDTLRALRFHKWSYYDGEYILMAIMAVFCLCTMAEPGPLIKTLLSTLLITALIIPITRQFFLPALPIFSWLVFFYTCKFIPAEWRPPISVRVLPALENIIYGANLSKLISQHQNPVFDILAWVPYGLIHFGAPFVVSLVLFIFGPPGLVNNFARAFGYMNATGVMIQLLFPCSPPWYENMYGFAEANYGMPGSPGGLIRIDQILGTAMYSSTFTASPVVFGALPSLHSANATIEALYLAYIFPWTKKWVIAYVFWMWWATMYLTHHYFVDLVFGSILAVCTFYINKRHFLPQIQKGRAWRWSYDFVVYGESQQHPLRGRKTSSAAAAAAWASLPSLDISNLDLEAAKRKSLVYSADDEAYDMDTFLAPAQTAGGRSAGISDNWEDETLRGDMESKGTDHDRSTSVSSPCLPRSSISALDEKSYTREESSDDSFSEDLDSTMV